MDMIFTFHELQARRADGCRTEAQWLLCCIKQPITWSRPSKKEDSWLSAEAVTGSLMSTVNSFRRSSNVQISLTRRQSDLGIQRPTLTGPAGVSANPRLHLLMTVQFEVMALAGLISWLLSPVLHLAVDESAPHRDRLPGGVLCDLRSAVDNLVITIASPLTISCSCGVPATLPKLKTILPRSDLIMSSNSAGPALTQGVGYGIVLGVGLAFAGLMVGFPSFAAVPRRK